MATPSRFCCIPSSVEECYQMAMDAFDLAERFQQLVFVMSDLDLGMNMWMSKPFDYPDARARPRQGARRRDGQAARAEWGRYKDVDGDGIPYRTIPGDRDARRISRAARATTSAASTANGRTTTSATSIASPASTRRPRRSCPQPVVEDAAARNRHHRLRHQPLGDRREPRAARGGGGIKTAYMRAARLPVLRRSRRLHRALPRASTWSSRTATRR